MQAVIVGKILGICPGFTWMACSASMRLECCGQTIVLFFDHHCGKIPSNVNISSAIA